MCDFVVVVGLGAVDLGAVYVGKARRCNIPRCCAANLARYNRARARASRSARCHSRRSWAWNCRMGFSLLFGVLSSRRLGEVVGWIGFALLSHWTLPTAVQSQCRFGLWSPSNSAEPHRQHTTGHRPMLFVCSTGCVCSVRFALFFHFVSLTCRVALDVAEKL